MHGRRKPYDPELARWASRAEREVARWLRLKGYDVTSLPEGQAGQDLLAQNEHERFYIEIERRTPKTWAEGPFPYSTVHVPERRAKTLAAGCLLFVLRRDVELGLIVFPQSLRPHILRQVANRYVEDGELFFDVPWHEVLPISLGDRQSITIAEMNVSYKRQQYAQCGKGIGGCYLRLRLLTDEPPYGMTEDEWKHLINKAETQIEWLQFQWGRPR